MDPVMPEFQALDCVLNPTDGSTSTIMFRLGQIGLATEGLSVQIVSPAGAADDCAEVVWSDGAAVAVEKGSETFIIATLQASVKQVVESPLVGERDVTVILKAPEEPTLNPLETVLKLAVAFPLRSKGVVRTAPGTTSWLAIQGPPGWFNRGTPPTIRAVEDPRGQVPWSLRSATPGLRGPGTLIVAIEVPGLAGRGKDPEVESPTDGTIVVTLDPINIPGRPTVEVEYDDEEEPLTEPQPEPEPVKG
ncbi:hypothetical protein [Tautonia marina]|uniref:hypothetical protein n=1 Tax=Tautonia marina TaxID=2653855 RepID=UPI0012609A63|nr:hypothetical protein [Tautonia marina]